MVAPAGTAEAFNKYLELQPTGKYADAAKQMLEQYRRIGRYQLRQGQIPAKKEILVRGGARRPSSRPLLLLRTVFTASRSSSRIRLVASPCPQPPLQFRSFAEARTPRRAIRHRPSPYRPEMLSLLEAAGLVLAEDLHADRDFPPFPRSTRDGYAVRAADLRSTCTPERALARSRRAHRLSKARSIAKRRSSGDHDRSSRSRGADAVVMVEHTSRAGDVVTVERDRSRRRQCCGRGIGSAKGRHDGGARHARESHYRGDRSRRRSCGGSRLHPAPSRHSGYWR